MVAFYMDCLLPVMLLCFSTSKSLNVLHRPPKSKWTELDKIMYLMWLKIWRPTGKVKSFKGPHSAFRVICHFQWVLREGLAWKSTIGVWRMAVVEDLSASRCWRVSFMPKSPQRRWGGGHIASRCNSYWILLLWKFRTKSVEDGRHHRTHLS